MRKFFAVFVLSVAVNYTAVFAQSSFLPGGNPNFKDKDLYLGAHLGMGGVYSFLGGVVNMEYGLFSNLGLTGSVGAFGYTTALWSYTQIPIIVGANYHFDIIKESKPSGWAYWDTWFGLGFGYVVSSWSSPDPTYIPSFSPGNYLTWDARLGARYFFSDKLAAKVELGYWALGYLRVGVDFKL
jgi:hypothetical protein